MRHGCSNSDARDVLDADTHTDADTDEHPNTYPNVNGHDDTNRDAKPDVPGRLDL